MVRDLAAALERHPDGTVELQLNRLEVALIGRIDRRGRMLWSMPKGHVEPGETFAQTARREVLEETGLNGTVLCELGAIEYWFVADGKRIHKTVHHHLIRYDDGELCDEDPEITEVAWVPFKLLPMRLAYEDERRLIMRAQELLPNLAEAEVAGRNPLPRPAGPVDPARRVGGSGGRDARAAHPTRDPRQDRPRSAGHNVARKKTHDTAGDAPGTGTLHDAQSAGGPDPAGQRSKRRRRRGRRGRGRRGAGTAGSTEA